MFFFNSQLRSQEFQFMISRHNDVKPLARHIVILSSVLVPSSKDRRLKYFFLGPFLSLATVTIKCPCNGWFVLLTVWSYTK